MKFIDYNFLNDQDYLYLGKVPKTKDNSLIIDWVYAGVSFSFNGSGVIFHFDELRDIGSTFVKVYVDGKENKYNLYLKANKIVIDYLEDTNHTVELIKVTEGEKELVLNGYTLIGENPHMLKPRAKKKIDLFFVGDSLTVGFGVNGNPEHEEYHSYEEDATMSYAYYTKKILDSEISASAHSGHGVVIDYSGSRDRTTMKEMFLSSSDNLDGLYDYKGYEPSIVIINAGTNDVNGGVNPYDFEEGCLELLLTIREKFKNAPIVWLYGYATDKYKERIESAIKRFNEKSFGASLLLVDSIKNNDSEFGSYNHPGIKGSIRVSKILADYIKKELKI